MSQDSIIPTREIPGYNGRYTISEAGQVWDTKRNKYMSQHADKKGYLRVRFYPGGGLPRKGLMVHRLVAFTYIPNPDKKPFINHMDSNPKNNNVTNLEWCTTAENNLHAAQHRLATKGKLYHTVKLTEDQIRYIKKKPYTISSNKLAPILGVNPSLVSYIRAGKHWKDVV